MDGAQLIVKERKRQVSKKGYTAAHDDQHVNEELASAAVYYAAPPKYGEMYGFYPWDPNPHREKHSRIDQLVIAGAFIAAEIDRLLRAQKDTRP